MYPTPRASGVVLILRGSYTSTIRSRECLQARAVTGPIPLERYTDRGDVVGPIDIMFGLDGIYIVVFRQGLPCSAI